MKKIVALLLALTVSGVLFACDKDGQPSDSSGTSSILSSDTEQKTILTMATNAHFKPYEFYDNSGNIIGIDAEIAQAIAGELGLTLKIEDMQFNTIITSVSEGSVDLGMAGMTVTEKRKESVDFSTTYATGKQVIITLSTSSVKTPDDLEGKKIGVQLGTTGDVYAEEDYGEENVVKYNNGNEAVLALIGGAVDAVIIDNEPAKSLVAANEGKGLVILETEYVYEEYAIAVKKGNTDLLNKLNRAIEKLTADGTIESIVNKYIPADSTE